MTSICRVPTRLTFLIFQQNLVTLTREERHTVIDALGKLRRLDWKEFYRSPGFKWERVTSITGSQRQTVYSLRASQKMRLLAWREGDVLRLLSIHPDHDSAYEGR